MAQATHTPAVTRTEVVEVTPETVTLVLSMEEASAVMAVTGAVYGSDIKTIRKHTDSVYYALRGIATDLWSTQLEGSLNAHNCLL